MNMSIRRSFGTQQLCEIENHRPIPNKFAGPLTTGKGSVKFEQRANHFLEPTVPLLLQVLSARTNFL
jgi:hypothetical protein